jgi:transcriptional adapter 2-alpha
LPSGSNSGKRVSNPLDIQNADGAELLTEAEKHLCSTLRLFPRAYFSIKDTILKENAIKGFVKRRSVRSLIKIDVNKTSRIFDFFLEMGWINTKAN